MRVAILGASGFIGKNLMLNLPNDWQTLAIYNSNIDFENWVKKNNINATCVRYDLSKPIEKSMELMHFDLVISLIGNTTKLDINKAYVPFNSDPLALIEFFKHCTCDKFLYFSSGCLYEGHTGIVSSGNTIDIKPFTPYAIAKRASESLIEWFKKEGKIKEYLCVRFFGAYGPYQREDKVTTKLIKEFYFNKKTEVTLFGNGANLIDAMEVSDTIDWILLAVQYKFHNETKDFGVASPITIKELTLKIASVCGIDNPKINWDTVNAPKENYYFMLGDIWFKPQTPFDYKFKVSWEQGLEKLKRHLILENK